MKALQRIVRTALLPVLLTGLCAAPALAGTRDGVAREAAATEAAGQAAGWTVERDVDPPSYAVIEPRRSTLNIDVVVLACEQADDRRILQLQLYLTNDGPLMPHGATAARAKTGPRAEVSIDGHDFPVALLFSEDHAVLADETEPMVPRLSERLLDAMEVGATMRLRFDLVAEPAGQPAAFDGEAVIDLQAGQGAGDRRTGARGKAVAAVRRCAPAPDLHSAALSLRR